MKELLIILLVILIAIFAIPALTGTGQSVDDLIAQRDAANAALSAATAQAAARSATEVAQFDATQQAVNLEIQATQQAEALTARQATQQAESTQAAIAYVATAGQMTAIADQATATAQSQFAQATATQQAQATLDAIYFQALATAQAAQAQVTVNEAQKSTLEAERAQMTNRLFAYLPYALLVLAIGIGVWVYKRQSRYQVVIRDVDGSTPGILDIDAGGFHKPERTPGPYTPFQTPEGKALPVPVFTPEALRTAMENEQKIDLVRASRNGTPSDWLKQLSHQRETPWSLLAENPALHVEIVEPDSPAYLTVEPVLKDATAQLIKAL